MTISLLLDLDGTLVDLAPPAPDLETLRARLVDLAAEHRVPLDHHGIFPIYGSVYASLGPDHPAAGRTRDVIDEYEVAWAATTARPLLDATGRAALERVSGWSLVTNNGRACVRTLVDRGLLPGTFAAAVTRDDGLPLKPSPEPLARALRTAAAARVWFVGDGDADAAAADALVGPAGTAVRFIRVTDGQVNAVLHELVQRAGDPKEGQST
jgi:phosphoglycolate phosphatase-like HAD superfamily hydrolase